MTGFGLVVVFLVFALWIVFGGLHFILIWFGHGYPIDKLGQWVDSFGALNALFAALGFTAVIWTLLIQQKQIRAAEKDQHRQRFDISYFELLKLLREARKDVRFRRTTATGTTLTSAAKTPSSGMRAFRLAWREARTRIKDSAFVEKAQVVSIYERHIHARFESDLGPYFRLLYTILDRIRGIKCFLRRKRQNTVIC